MKITDAGEFILEFDALPRSFNQMLREHWSKRTKERDYWASLIRSHFKLDQLLPEPCEITVKWRVLRLMDEDNASARFKLIGDALVQARVLSDDNPSVIKKLNVSQQIVKHRQDQGFVLSVRPFTGGEIVKRKERNRDTVTISRTVYEQLLRDANELKMLKAERAAESAPVVRIPIIGKLTARGIEVIADAEFAEKSNAKTTT